MLSLTTTNSNGNSNGNNSNNKPTQRRDFVNTAIIGSATGLIASSFPYVSWAAADDNPNKNNQQQLPFCVIGANGKTGTKCVQDILSRGMAVKASSRSGIYYETTEKEEETSLENNNTQKKNRLLLPTICDVTVPSTVDSAVKGSCSDLCSIRIQTGWYTLRGG